MPTKVPVSQLQGSVCHEEAIDARGFCDAFLEVDRRHQGKKLRFHGTPFLSFSKFCDCLENAS